jgi:hypothetical protein
MSGDGYPAPDPMTVPRPKRRLARRRWGSLALGAIALTAGCRDMLTDLGQPAPPPVAPVEFGSPVGGVLFSGALTTPATNSGGGATPWAPLGYTAPEAQWIEIRTTGSVEYTINEGTWEAPCGLLCTDFAPMYGSGEVGGNGIGGNLLAVDFAFANLNPPVGAMTPVYRVEDGQRVHLAFVQQGWSLWARRNGIPGQRSCAGCPPEIDPGPYPWYLLSGSHQVQVRAVTPAQVAPDRKRFQPGDSITWRTELYPGVLRIDWFFRATNAPIGEWVQACTFRTVCTFAPPAAGGVMQIMASWPHAGGLGIAYSSPVTVGVDECPASQAVGASFVCEEEQEPKLVLTCGSTTAVAGQAAPPADSVVRGSNWTCTASANNGGSLEQIEWQFVGEWNHTATLSNTNRWSGPMAAGGTMTVELSRFGGRFSTIETSGELSTRCEESTVRCSSPQQRVGNSVGRRGSQAAAFCFSRSNWIGERYPSAECRRRGLYHPSMKSNTFIRASA